MSDSRADQLPPPPDAYLATSPKKKRRIFLWVFLAIQVLFIIWIISVGNTPNTKCNTSIYQTAKDCDDLNTAARGLGIGVVIAFWFVADFILGVGYGIYHLAKRR